MKRVASVRFGVAFGSPTADAVPSTGRPHTHARALRPGGTAGTDGMAAAKPAGASVLSFVRGIDLSGNAYGERTEPVGRLGGAGNLAWLRLDDAALQHVPDAVERMGNVVRHGRARRGTRHDA